MHRIAEVQAEGGSRRKCRSAADLALNEGDLCIVEEDGIQEYGSVVTLSGFVDETPEPRARVVRRATLQDRSRAGENARLGGMAWDECEAQARALRLPLRMIQVHYSFDRNVLFVLYTSEEKVDLREWIRTLCSKLHARIAAQQVGVRDAAGMVGGMGCCGRQMCCSSWMKSFESVNVRMAKAQNLALNPTTISGQCGRLKCCLRYEYEAYREADRDLPRQGARVRCQAGIGRVIEKNILCRRVKVMLEDRRTLTYPASEVEAIIESRGGRANEEAEDPGGERTESAPAGDPSA